MSLLYSPCRKFEEKLPEQLLQDRVSCAAHSGVLQVGVGGFITIVTTLITVTKQFLMFAVCSHRGGRSTVSRTPSPPHTQFGRGGGGRAGSGRNQGRHDRDRER